MVKNINQAKQVNTIVIHSLYTFLSILYYDYHLALLVYGDLPIIQE